MRMRAFLVGASLALSGCASPYYPDLYKVETTGLPIRADMKQAIDTAAALQSHYAKNYKQVGMIRDITQLPIIVAAGVSGLVLLDGGPDAVNEAGEIGILAATFSAGSKALTSPDMAGYYIRGHGALTCAMAIGAGLADSNAQAGYLRHKSALAAQAGSISALEHLIGLSPKTDANTTDAQRSLVAASIKLARTTLATARTERTSALGEIAAYDGAVTAFQLEASQISVAVASKGQVRTNADYKAIMKDFDLPSAGGDNPLEMNADFFSNPFLERVKNAAGYPDVELKQNALSHEVLSALINAAVEQLLTSTANLQGMNPGFKASIDEMKKCSDIVSA